jgi:CheY-like chemotaxis protein
MMAGSDPHSVAAPRQILVVDDDEVFREATGSLLRSAGHDVHLAPDYRLALQTLEGGAPLDLLVVDIVMPDGVNGLALARMARLRRPSLKIIYLTGYDISGNSDEALGPIIRKPVDNDLFLAEVGRALKD